MNQSYCRFHNTLLDLRECAEVLDELEGSLTTLSEEEAKAAKRLIQVCKDITDQFGAAA
jgi:hypothetical protein